MITSISTLLSILAALTVAASKVESFILKFLSDDFLSDENSELLFEYKGKIYHFVKFTGESFSKMI